LTRSIFVVLTLHAQPGLVETKERDITPTRDKIDVLIEKREAWLSVENQQKKTHVDREMAQVFRETGNCEMGELVRQYSL